MIRQAFFLTAFTAAAIGSFMLLVTSRMRHNFWGAGEQRSYSKRRLADTTRDLKAKETRYYDLIMEFDEDNDLTDPSCVEDVVEDDLALNVFNFMLENDLIEEKEKRRFLDDWDVDVLSFNEVEIIETPPDEECKDQGCRETEVECEGEECARMLSEKTSSKKKRKWKKNRRKRRYSVRTKAKCSLCFPDNNAAGRKLISDHQRSYHKIIKQDINKEASTSLRGTSSEIRDLLRQVRALEDSEEEEGSGEEEETKPDTSEKNNEDNSVTSQGGSTEESNSKQEIPAPESESNSQKENKVSSQGDSTKKTAGEKQEAPAPQEQNNHNSNDNGGYDHHNHGDWDWDQIKIYLKQIIDELIKRFQERTGQEFKKEIHKGCHENPTRAELIYLEHPPHYY